MTELKNVVSEIERYLASDEGYNNPLEQLVGLANGIDINHKSDAYYDLEDILVEYPDDVPDLETWKEFSSTVLNEFKYKPVNASVSRKAQELLLKYMYAQKKPVEEFTANKDLVEIVPLTAEEVEMFELKLKTFLE